jgi:hypothetical protein
MKNHVARGLLAVAVTLIIWLYEPSVFAQGSAFTYQGRLNDGGQPARGTYDFRFRLVADESGATAKGGSADEVLASGVAVSNGTFTATLDFGAGAFCGSALWLEIGVRTNGSDNYTTLAPLQAITPAPYAIMASSASNLLGTLPISQLSGPGAVVTVSASGALSVTNLSLGGDTSAGGSVIASGDVFAGGNVSATGNISASGNVSASSTMSSPLVQGGTILPRIFTNWPPDANSLDSGIAWYGGQDPSSGHRVAFLRAYEHFSGNTNWPFDRVLMMGAPNIRLECAWETGVGTICLGNEDHCGNVFINYVNPALYGGPGTNVVVPGYLLLFRAQGYDTNGVLYEGQPGIQAWSCSNSGAGANLSLDFDTHTEGELWFYTRAPRSNLGSSAPYDMTEAEVGARMLATKRWEFAGGITITNPAETFTGNGAGLTNLNVDALTGADSIARTTDVWLLNGNSGTTAGNYLGTLDSQPLGLQVNGLPALTLGLDNDLAMGTCTTSSRFSVALGGWTTASGTYATVGGGLHNVASGAGAFVGGGGYDGIHNSGNVASGGGAAIGGGAENTASGLLSTVNGGLSNLATNMYATVAGGASNVAGGVGSFAAGEGAKAYDDGSFVWGDTSTTSDVASSGPNSVTMRAAGGYQLFADSSLSTGVYLAPGSGSWSSLSDRNAKENVDPVNVQDVLQKVAALPLSTWNYKSQDASIRHLGPMAQDFRAAFGLGESDRAITSVDEQGVALAAIQGLNEKVKELQTALDRRDAENAELKRRLERLERELERDK